MKTKIVIIGSGWAGASFIKYLDSDKFDVTVVSNYLEFIYTPLLTYKSMNNINLNYLIVSINDNIKTIKKNIDIEMIDFNNNTLCNNFNYNDKGSFFYYGQGNSIYNYKKTFQFGGKLTGYLNNLVHLYNCINFKQSLQIFQDKYLK